MCCSLSGRGFDSVEPALSAASTGATSPHYHFYFAPPNAVPVPIYLLSVDPDSDHCATDPVDV